MPDKRLLLGLGAVVMAALVVSGIAPYDRATWFLEVAPVFIAAPILLVTYRRFPLTPLLYVLIAAHALVLILGGAYTYARVPPGFWVQDFFALGRNPYDKLGHFMQGFVPVLIAREILLRGGYVTGRRMAAFLSLCVALAVSALYELIEWWAALALGQGADEFLGAQGDVWDTQSDMFMALIGAALALLTLSRLQDRQMAALRPRFPGPVFRGNDAVGGLQEAIVAAACGKLGRALTAREAAFVTSRGGLVALEMILDTVRVGSAEEVERYLNSESDS